MAEAQLIHIVDDEESVRKSASFLLRTSGFETQTYASGVAFLKAAGSAEPAATAEPPATAWSQAITGPTDAQ